MATKKGSKRPVITLAADEVSASQTGVAIRGIEYADDHRTASGLLSSGLRIERFAPEELELTYRRSGLIFKGINKKARDAFKAGFEVVPDDEIPEKRRTMNLAVRTWLRERAFVPKAEQAVREAYTYGDGFLELVYPGDPASPAPGGTAPLRVKNVNPFTIRPVKDHRAGSPTRDDIVAYWFGDENIRKVPVEQVRKWVETGEKPREVQAVIHPSRLAHFQPYAVRGDPDGLGLSVIEAAYFAALSKTTGIHSLGDILEWAGQGFLFLNIDFATEDELKAAEKKLAAAKKARKTYFVASERAKGTFAEPVLPNVDSFFNQFHVEFAGALEMPTMILMGVQKGTVSGSSVDIIEYYDDVGAFQRSHVEPHLFPILVRVLNTSAFSVRFTPLYVDKQTRADQTFKVFQAATAAVGAQVFTRRQAVEFMRRELPDADLPDPSAVPDEYVEKPEPSMVGAKPDSGAPGTRGDREADD